MSYFPNSLNPLLIVALLSIALGACATTDDDAAPDSAIFAQTWINGSGKDEPSLQAQRYDPNTVVIRQSLKTSFEAPFIYLLFGEDKALLIDTGAGGVDLRSMVDRQIGDWLAANGRDSISLVVMHSHAHGDHVAGDEQFADRVDTVIVGHSAAEVADFFGIERWPNETRAFDLGRRTVDIIPTPGHHDTHVVVYDNSTRLLFSGDVLYPGRLYFRCDKAREYRDSIDRIAEFVNARDASWILGAHIELAREAGKSYNSNELVRANERLLEMTPATISGVQSALTQMGDRIRVESHANFILFPHPADPRGQQPPDWCLGEN